MKLRDLTFLWNAWPPFIGLGIRIKRVTKDFKHVRVTLKKRPWNMNYFGVHYGGGIFAMTDGVHVLMLIRNLPRKYVIWDKAASIEYLRRGDTDLVAEFIITDADLQQIETEIAEKSKINWEVQVDVKDKHGHVVAKVKRVLFIRDKLEK